MRLILILFATLLCCVVVNAKNASGEKALRKKCKDESCEYKKIDRYKDEGEKFRWNRNFKNHKNNIYDVDKKETESVYKPKLKKSEDEVETKKFAKKSKKRFRDSGEEEINRQKKLKNKKSKAKIKESASVETSEDDDDSVEQPSTELQCDSSEQTCRAE